MSGITADLTPSELYAVEVHKYYLSRERQREILIDEAIADFRERFARDWRRDKAIRDNLAQQAEIEKHRYCRSRELGHDLGAEQAALEWCSLHAAAWREHRESLEQNGFRRRTIVARNPRCGHLRGWMTIAVRAAEFDCDVYVHRSVMAFGSFMLGRRPFVNVKSMTSLMSLGLAFGHRLDLIAMGAQAEPALDALEAILETPAR